MPPLSGSMPRLANAGVELGRLAGDADVAAEGEVHAVAGGAAVQRADRRRVEVVEHDRRGVAQLELAGADVEVPTLPRPPLRALAWAAQVEAGAERPARRRSARWPAPRGRGRRRAALATAVSSIGPEIVFMRSGAFSVMVATWSATSYQDLVSGASMAEP